MTPRRIALAVVATGLWAAAPARAQLCHPAADSKSDDDVTDDGEFDDDPAPPPAPHGDMAGMDMSGDMAGMDMSGDTHAGDMAGMDMSGDAHAGDMAGMDMSGGAHGGGDDLAAHHRAAPGPSTSTVTARADLETDYAAIDLGTYAGIVPSVELGWWRLDLRVAAPIYHLEYRGVKSDGPGDMLYTLTGTILDGRAVRAGAGVAFTDDNGNGKVGLGMGHRMVMPNAWASWTQRRWAAIASASWGTVLGSTAGHMHGVGEPGSLVSPMNMEEVTGAIRVAYRATRAMRVHALTALAAPIGAGTTRGYAATGVRWTAGSWEVGVEAALGVVGSPFRTRFALDVARTW